MTSEINPYPAITKAMREGRGSDMQRLFSDFPGMEKFDVPGFGNWLIYASAHGNGTVVEALLDRGFPLDARDKRGEQSPISTAASYGRAEIVALLLNRGASMDTDSMVINPLFGAVLGESLRVAELLLQAGIDTKVAYPSSHAPVAIDAVTFAMLRGQRGIARAVALRNSGGNDKEAEAAMAEGLRIAHLVSPPG